MNKFEHLILQLLLNEKSKVAAPTAKMTTKSNRNPQTNTNKSPSILDFVTNKANILRLIGSDYQKKFGEFGGAPDEHDMQSVCNAWSGAFSRTTAAPFKNLGNLLPIICLVYLLVKAHKGAEPKDNDINLKWDDKKATSVLKAFHRAISTETSMNPIDFQLVRNHPKLAEIQRGIKKYVGTNVGQIALDKYRDKSIRDALYEMLAARKKDRLKTLENKTVPDAGKAVESVLRDPDRFAGGQRMFDIKLTTVYTEPVQKDILNISIAAKKFFEEQVQSNTPQYDEPNSKLMCRTTLWDFLTNKQTPDNNFVFQWSDGTSERSKTLEAGGGGYTIQNIKALAATNRSPGAAMLVRELEDFANYLRNQEPSDWAGKFQRGAQGTAQSLGTLSKALGPSVGM